MQILTGMKFGRLLVTENFYYDKSRKLYWTCVCDCGTIKDVYYYYLLKANVVSCGCLKKEGWNKLPKDEAERRTRYHWYTKNARTKSLQFEISRDEAYKLFSDNCFYCGISPDPCNGIDRKDNTKGYIPGNIVSACKICNRAKNTLTEQEFIRWIARVHRFIFEEKEHSTTETFKILQDEGYLQ